MPASILQLYSTHSCTLCEQALDLLLSLPELAGRELSVVDIAEDENLMSAYAEKIPVLKLADAELCAPFTGDQVTAWLRALEP